MSEERLTQLGYAVDGDGHLVTAGDVPVGPLYQILQYWGGEKQHHRWHLKYPIELNPSRNGDPLFMDQNMVAFEAQWKDTQRMDEALLELCNLFATLNDKPVAVPLVIELAVQ